jgi:hypothetical protein
MRFHGYRCVNKYGRLSDQACGKRRRIIYNEAGSKDGILSHRKRI